MVALDRQPMNPSIIKDITDELILPIGTYKHARPHVSTTEPNYKDIPKRPRHVKVPK